MEARRYSYRVQPREVDSSKCATLMTIGDYILHTAGEDADKNGFGVETLQESNMTWVISRMAVEMLRFPMQKEEYSIETWVEDVSRMMTTRNFTIRDARDGIIGCASTLWAVIDFGTRLPLDLRPMFDYADKLTPMECPIVRPKKINNVDGKLVHRHKVGYSDVDFNSHANSMKYVEWMMDTLPMEKLTEKRLSRLDINFVHEIRYGQTVDIYAENGDVSDRFELKSEDGTVVCKAQLEWDGEFKCNMI